MMSFWRVGLFIRIEFGGCQNIKFIRMLAATRANPTVRKNVTVDGKLSLDVNINNLKSMERQSGLRFQDFVN